jgi:glutaredoxin
MAVTVFTSNGCGPCEMVKGYLLKEGVAFEEKNVSTDVAAREHLISLGHRATPVTVVGEQRIVGYKPDQLAEALRAAG